MPLSGVFDRFEYKIHLDTVGDWRQKSSKIDYCTIIEYGAKEVVQETGDGWLWDDATWVLCASFIIFTMQTGKTKVETYFSSGTLASSLIQASWEDELKTTGGHSHVPRNP